LQLVDMGFGGGFVPSEKRRLMHASLWWSLTASSRHMKARRTLLEMDDKREIRVHADAVLLKGADGNTTVKDTRRMAAHTP